jgi:hypothetical protein
MHTLHRLVVELGSRANPGGLLAGLFALQLAWSLILGAFDAQFQQVAGYPLPAL